MLSLIGPHPSSSAPMVSTVDGEQIPKSHHLTNGAVVALVVIGLAFIIFLYFYISPLCHGRLPSSSLPSSRRNNVTTTSASISGTVDVEASASPTMTTRTQNEKEDTITTEEKSTLLAWMRRRSRGRFADTTGNTRPLPNSRHRFSLFPRPLPDAVPSTPARPRPGGTTGRSRPSFFSRISVIPHLIIQSEIQRHPATPPPAYATRPGTPTSPSPSSVQFRSVPTRLMGYDEGETGTAAGPSTMRGPIARSRPVSRSQTTRRQTIHAFVQPPAHDEEDSAHRTSPSRLGSTPPSPPPQFPLPNLPPAASRSKSEGNLHPTWQGRAEARENVVKAEGSRRASSANSAARVSWVLPTPMLASGGLGLETHISPGGYGPL